MKFRLVSGRTFADRESSTLKSKPYTLEERTLGALGLGLRDLGFRVEGLGCRFLQSSLK